MAGRRRLDPGTWRAAVITVGAYKVVDRLAEETGVVFPDRDAAARIVQDGRDEVAPIYRDVIRRQNADILALLGEIDGQWRDGD